LPSAAFDQQGISDSGKASDGTQNVFRSERNLFEELKKIK